MRATRSRSTHQSLHRLASSSTPNSPSPPRSVSGSRPESAHSTTPSVSTLPSSLLAYTTLSLHFHTENLYRPHVPPPIKHLCYGALADLFKYLPASKADPHDVAARQKLQIASWMSLWPLKLDKYSALGLSHALGHKLGATYGIPHGITSVSVDLC